MTPFPKIDMAEATRLTREGRLDDAMAILRGPVSPGAHARQTRTTGNSAHATAESLLGGFLARLPSPGATKSPAGPRTSDTSEPATPGSFHYHTYNGAGGDRSFKLYVPRGYDGKRMPLVVMLHGCTQSPDDFAAGTRMNALAETRGFLVAYPEQTRAANMSRCWNWFNAGDQNRDGGEPALIAGMTRQIVASFAVDENRIYVAGLSAGGAAAAIMGSAYPDLFAAVGVHSGLACGAASDLGSAFAAMRQGGATVSRRPSSTSVPTIVFHGDRDATVHPVNGDQVIAQSAPAATLGTVTTKGKSPGGAAFTRTVRSDAGGRAIQEQWVVHGAGHAWSGGSPAGSYTDPTGPDASTEMVRFFLAHSLKDVGTK